MSLKSFNEVVEAIHMFNEAKATSLPQFTKPAIIESPNFIQASLIEEPIIGDIIKNLYNVYIGYILVALKMNDQIAGNRTVRDALGTVSTGMNVALEEFIGTDSIISKFEGTTEATKSASYLVDKDVPPLPSGRTLEIKFATKDSKSTIDVMLNLKINNRVVPDEVVEYVIEGTYKPDLAQRWLQMKSGEIRFFKDFIFNLDTLSKRSRALKHDKDNALKDIFRHQNNSSLRQVLKTVMYLSNNAAKSKSYNLANAIMMFDENIIRKYTKRVGLDFNNVKDRRRFFESTFALFIVLVDTRYSRVNIYTNSIDQVGSYSFSDIKSGASSDKLELKEIVEYLAKSQLPKF